MLALFIVYQILTSYCSESVNLIINITLSHTKTEKKLFIFLFSH